MEERRLLAAIAATRAACFAAHIAPFARCDGYGAFRELHNTRSPPAQNSTSGARLRRSESSICLSCRATAAQQPFRGHLSDKRAALMDLAKLASFVPSTRVAHSGPAAGPIEGTVNLDVQKLSPDDRDKPRTLLLNVVSAQVRSPTSRRSKRMWMLEQLAFVLDDLVMYGAAGVICYVVLLLLYGDDGLEAVLPLPDLRPPGELDLEEVLQHLDPDHVAPREH